MLFSRIIVLPSSAFDSKVKFLNDLRRKYGGGTFNLGGEVTASDLSLYYSYLKEEYRGEGAPKVYFESEHLGHQCDTYWMLSSEVTSRPYI